MKALVLAVWLALALPADLRDWPGGPEARYAQRWPGPYDPRRPRPYDRGNCFHWPGCRGESLGAMWVHAPEFCAALGGRSWLDGSTGRCHDIPPGPRGKASSRPPAKPASL